MGHLPWENLFGKVLVSMDSEREAGRGPLNQVLRGRVVDHGVQFVEKGRDALARWAQAPGSWVCDGCVLRLSLCPPLPP